MNSLNEDRENLRAAYIAANEDTDRNKVICDWDAIESGYWLGALKTKLKIANDFHHLLECAQVHPSQ